MDSAHVAELILSDNAEESLIKYGILAWITLFSILFDPEVDGEHKRRHASDMVLFTDGELYIAYRLVANGDLYIGFVRSETDIDRM